MKSILIIIKNWLILVALCLPLVSCANASGNVFPLENPYIRQPNLSAMLRRIDNKGGSISRLHLIGFSTNEDLPIYALEIGSPKAAQKVLIIGQHHGDEVLGVEVAVAFAEYLSVNYPGNRKVKDLLEHYQFWIIPTINPEGYRVVTSGEYPWKRKNNSDTNRNGVLDIRTDGVDLNRNYPLFWEHDPVTQPESPYFKGFAPLSESECIAVVDLAERVRFDYAIFYHSSATGAYSEKLYLPWFHHTNDEDRAAVDEIRSIAQRYASMLPKDYSEGFYEVHSGFNSRVANARNYFFHAHRTKAFLVEIGGINSFGISVIHPSARIMRQNVKKHINALTTLFHERI